MRHDYDIAVIGAGPAGMMAAGQAALRGARVVLIEKNRMPGAKLLITGKGRCNIAKCEYDARRFIEPFGKKGKFLYPAFHAFGTQDTIHFFNTRGLPTKVERGNRIFPAGGGAGDVLRVLTDFLLETKVRIMTGTSAKGLERKGERITSLLLSNRELTAARYIVCTGGLSYPSTGSTGEGLSWIEGLGHTVVPFKPGLVPVILEEPWPGELKGFVLKNAHVAVYQNGRKRDERFGEASFTGRGMDGPIILDMSKNIGTLLEAKHSRPLGLKDPVYLRIDIKPALEFDVLDARIRRDFREKHNKAFKNSLDKLLPRRLIPVIVRLSGIPPLKKADSLTREERHGLTLLLKRLEVRVKGLEGFKKAIITAGGVALNEVEPKTMKSRLIKNLYFAGEILDLDGPTGGYNLQVCWSTGYAAGQAAAGHH